MLVTNVADRRHTYRDRVSRILYIWDPGQTVDVPTGVGLLVTGQHPHKLVAGGAESLYRDVSMVEYPDREMVASRRPGRPRRR